MYIQKNEYLIIISRLLQLKRQIIPNEWSYLTKKKLQQYFIQKKQSMKTALNLGTDEGISPNKYTLKSIS